MTHISPEPPPSKHRISECRKGRHDYANGQHIGAGIMRRVCQTCADVTIDITGSELASDEMTERQDVSELTATHQ